MSIAKSELPKLFFVRKLTKRHISTRSKFILGLLLLLVLGLDLRLPGLLARDTRKASPTMPTLRALPVETLTVEALSSYQASRAYTGLIEARRRSNLGFERAGKLIALAVDEGVRVTQDTPLATLDTQELRARRRELLAHREQAAARLVEMRAGPRQETIAAARAQVHEQQEELALAQRHRTRRQGLLAKGVIAPEEFDQAEAGVKTWQARLDAAQRRLDELLAGTRREQVQAQKALVAQLDARLAALDIDLEKSVLKAPFAGTIAARMVDEGTVITAGQPILRLLEDTQLEARVGVPPHVAATLALGSHQRVRVGQTTHTARVTALLPELDSTTRTVTVVMAISEAAATVVPGQVARLQLEETVPTAGFWLPTTALTKGDRGLWSCFTLVPESGEAQAFFRPERRTVEILYTDNDRVFVRGLLQPGEHVVKTGIHRLVAGQRVRPIAHL